ncbi:MAG: DUF4416 family protein [Deltaproteobacteria bacterium]|nr:DUF4416 family protein [Deltaproteobacteria bacterium]
MKSSAPQSVKPVVSIFTGEVSLFKAVLLGLIERLGPVDILSPVLAFDHTDYYEKEFGKALKRRLASFERLIRPDELADVKIFTNGLERSDFCTEDGKRRVNIDPGFMALEKFVLASCKNFSHRIYIGQGVYAELTLMYEGSDFVFLPWTYPDYKDERTQAILRRIRKRHAFDVLAARAT